ncbi:unnamed protein product, partial [Mesorhabditis spiculigera]
MAVGVDSGYLPENGIGAAKCGPGDAEREVEMWVPPLLRSETIRPDECQLVVKKDEESGRTRYTYTLVWKESNAPFAGTNNSGVNNCSTVGAQRFNDKRQGLESLMCDGPCRRNHPPGHFVPTFFDEIICTAWTCYLDRTGDHGDSARRRWKRSCPQPDCCQPHPNETQPSTSGSSTASWPSQGTLCERWSPLVTARSDVWSSTSLVPPVQSFEPMKMRAIVLRPTQEGMRRLIWSGDCVPTSTLREVIQSFVPDYQAARVFICRTSRGTAGDHQLVNLDMREDGDSPIGKYIEMARHGVLELAIDFSRRITPHYTF